MSEEDKEIVPEEAIIPQEELDLELELDDTEDVEAIKAKAEQATTFARQALARAKKAEAENALLKKPKLPATQTSTSSPSVEETVLLANGMDENLMEKLKAVAKVQGVSLIKAQSDPIFIAVKEGFEKEQKQKSASLPASRGSGATKPKVDFSTVNLDRDAHKALALKAAEEL